MQILTIKTGVEKYANRIYTTKFFLIDKSKDDDLLLTDHQSYTPHERIICGLNSCFGEWEIGHILVPDKSKIIMVATRKVLVHDPHNEADAFHVSIRAKFTTPGRKQRRYTQNYWGYNNGKILCELLVGNFDLVDEKREAYKLGTPLDKLPF